MSSGLVIIGAGQAAAQAIQTLRKNGFSESITLVGNEPQFPYQRPPLSKKFLAGELPEDRLLLRPAKFYESNNVEAILNETVISISVESKEVTTSNSRKLSYGKLLISTGSKARTVPLPGSQLNGVFTIRTIADVEKLRPLMQSGRRMVIVGAGYIGLEVAAIARQLNLEVAVIEAQDRVLKRVVSPNMSSFFKNLHEGKDVDIRVSTQSVEIRGDTDAEEVILSDGSTLSCDLVLIAVGSQPNDEIANENGMEAEDGIIVDCSCQTSVQDVFAAGDCTRFHSNRFGRSIRLESVQNAIDQGEAAGKSIRGEKVEYDPVPWFWSDQYEIKLQMAGLSQGYDQAITVGDPESRVFYIAYLKEGNLIAVDSICHPRSYMLARRNIGQPWQDDLLPTIG